MIVASGHAIVTVCSSTSDPDFVSNVHCPTSHPDFVGRSIELEILKDTFLIQRNPPDETIFHFLYGLGGIGKSELAKRFANMHREDFSLIWFFPSSDPTVLYEGYQNLAKSLQVHFSDQDDLSVLQKHVRDHLERTSLPKPYLIIFDNIEEAIDPQKLPQRGGAILMISREKEHWRGSSTPIKEFKEGDALALFQKITQEKVSYEMKKLSETLGRFPFLINQVAHYISAENMTISQYLKHFDFKNKNEVSIDKRYTETLETICEITFKRLGEKHPLALDWLKVCAFLHPDEIPIHWLDGWLEERNIENPIKKGIEILGALGKYALIRERRKDHAFISLHRLLQEALQTRVKNPSSFLSDVYQLIKKYSKDFDPKNGNHRWIPHLEEILEFAKKKNFYSFREIEKEIYGYLGIAYQALNEYQKALEYHQKHLAIAKELKDQRGMGNAYRGIGIACKSLGEYQKALEYHQKHLAIAKELKDQRGMGNAYRGIGIAHYSLGEYQKALEYHKKDLAIAEKLNDKEGMGNTYRGIGNVYQALGNYQKALEYHQKHLAIAKKLSDKGGIGNAYGNMGVAYQSLGNYQQALKYHKENLKIAQEIDQKGGMGNAYGNIGIAYRSLGEYQESLEYLKKDLAIAQEIGDKGVEGRAYGGIGDTYQALGNYQKALEYHQKHLVIAEKLSDKGGMGKAYCNLGNAYDSLGEIKQAGEAYQNAIDCYAHIQGLV